MQVAERSIAAVAVTFPWWKVTKNQVSRNASLPHEPLPCKSNRTTGCNYLPCFARTGPGFCKTCYALTATQSTIVLSAFVRSLSADGEENTTIILSFWTKWRTTSWA